jgi:hypothetical protein
MRKIALSLLAAFVVSDVYAGAPFVTDDPMIVDEQTWEVNYMLVGVSNQSGSLPRRRRDDDRAPGTGTATAVAFQIDANYGITPRMHLHIQPQLIYLHEPVGANYGLGDTQVGVKYQVTPNGDDEKGWVIGVHPLVTLPTGNSNRNLGLDVTTYYLPVWVQRRYHEWTTFGGGGYQINGGTNRDNTWAGGWGVLYDATPKLQLGGEIFGQTASLAGSHGTVGFNLGGVWQLANGHAFLFSAGKGLRNVAVENEASLFLGWQAHY